MTYNLLTKLFTRENRGKILTMIFSYFAFFYHLGFLFFFRHFQVLPMYYFNFFSVPLFLILSIRGTIGKKYFVTFSIALIEVAIHQILADYYIGVYASFHYFILATGLLTLLVFNKKFPLAIFYSLLSAVTYFFLEKLGRGQTPIYFIPEDILFIVKLLNTAMGLFVILLGVFISSFLINRIEDNLEFQVEQKTKELKERNERVNLLQNHIINSLASLVENRDQDTGEHIQRTSAYVELIASKALEKGYYPDVITEEFVDTVKRAAPMHDIGKIIVPDTILRKPGKLDADEFMQMQRHTLEGHRIIEETIGVSEDENYINIASEIALSHHERWDGHGYPNHIQMEEIPVSARIMAIADVFDALVSKRCYKEPLPLDKAFQIIQEDKELHFDPVFADIFLENRQAVEEIFYKYNK